jgi:hypothetical protein
MDSVAMEEGEESKLLKALKIQVFWKVLPWGLIHDY